MFIGEFDSRELERAIERFRLAGSDLTPIAEIIAEQLVSDVNDEFETKGHGRWPGLAASTRKAKARKGYTMDPLKATDRLATSIRPYAGVDFAEAATDVDYAVYHVSSAPRAKIPLRDPFDVPDSAIDRANETLLRELKAAMEGS